MDIFRRHNEERKLAQAKNVLLKDLQVVNGQRIEFYQNQSRDLRKELRKTELKGWFKSTLYFLSGVLITGTIAYGLNRVVIR